MRAAALAVTLLLGGCTMTGERGPTLYFQCDDGSGFNAELRPRALRLYTAVGPIELPRRRHDGDGELYSNGLRSVVLLAGGRARHSLVRDVWVDCSAG